MAVEPLSESTKTAKRNLLVASVLAVTYRAFDVTVDKLPFAGIVIDFNTGVFAFLLTVLLCYFLLTFCVYYFIDIRNLEAPPHQTRSNEQYWENVEDRVQRFLHIAKNRADRAIDGGDVHVLYTAAMGNLLRQLARTPRAEHEQLILEAAPRTLYELHMRNALSSVVQYPARAEEFGNVDTVVNRALWDFPDFERGTLLMAKSRLAGMNSIYGFRNYILEGALPIALGVTAILAMYQVVPLEWIKHIAPVQ
jgi:hypothetical protein